MSERFTARKRVRNGVETWEAHDSLSGWLATFEGPTAEADALREVQERTECARFIRGAG